MICAGNIQTNVIHAKLASAGDSGGSLLLKKDNYNEDEIQTLLGFVSIGIQETNYGSFTKLSSYISWIAGVKEEYQNNESK